MKFVDEVRIFAKSGDGGDGHVAFLREKNRPNGGPAGGDGGKGGDVVFVADPNMATLLDFQYTRKWIANDGERGGKKNCSGLAAEDLIVRVPAGTVIYDDDTGDLLHDLKKPGERWIALKGGHGGRGNQHFATPRNQAPRKFEPGVPGEERNLRLELKLLADVGLVGYPNAGKSTLLSRISAARPKIADYPFTTLVPNLGVVRAKGDRTFVVADTPGLIEGAHEGVGLGIRFLRHIERTAIFVHVIDFFDPEDGGPWERFKKVEKELYAYDKALKDRPALLAANKM
ncbi:MAG TPA: GTPase ObgE, partial [bacterium]|nr:GTPase ObgE [bacterium]